ncbi:MAG: hypothetical protein J0M04_06320 [Verrucomicrobia bacterium]|nr:hypothetical protein [Verrucomicrobiota bacterium]
MRLLIRLVPCLLVASCATKKEENVVPLGQQTMNQKFNSSKALKQDEKGNWPAEVRAMNVAETNRKSAYFTGEANQPKAFKTERFQKAKWWGGKTYEGKPYTGNTDASRLKTAARDQNKGAREGTVEAPTGRFGTGTYPTAQAREASGKRMDKTADAKTENRRDTYPEPEIMGYQEQRKMQIKDVNSIMGRN